MKSIGLSKMICVVFILCIGTAIAASAQTTFTNLANFNGANGTLPQFMSPVQGTDGNFYGVTFEGGTSSGNSSCGTFGCGTVFKVTPAGKLTTIYNFCSQGGSSCTDGAYPIGSLVRAGNGDFYGVAGAGGSGAEFAGTVFKITPAGKLTTIYNFCSHFENGTCADGSGPNGLVQGTDGNFYGTTFAGGASGNGIGFKVTAGGALTTLYNFCSQGGLSCTDGSSPVAPLVQGTDGNFYGTTFGGGANDVAACALPGGGLTGCGTVFRITASGELTTLHSFDLKDGFGSEAPLVEGTDGNFYGTTFGGGTHYLSACEASGDSVGCGTVFKITPAGKLTTLHSFDVSDGHFPDGGVIQATDGNFYGMAASGGAHSGGTLFRITSTGKLTTLYNFCSQGGGSSCTDGSGPNTGLVQGTSGTIYGTTTGGGSSPCSVGCGTVFSLSVGLGPFVETSPTAGAVGVKVTILGSNLKGASSVTFNGATATYKVVSDTEISTKVPTGATTGTVEVTTPSGTLKSNVAFQVLP
jgi:uncharacterized repeat protein (TIGR03803 family)